MVDQRAARGFVRAEEYERYRPSYPPGAVAYIRESGCLDERSTVVDLGAGTGLMTRLLHPVGRLIAVEPLSEMRAVLHERVPETEVVEGAAEAIPLATGIADAVVVAQAFHWFANPEALSEIARVLKTEGALFLVWNENDPDDELMRRLDAGLAHYRRGSPRYGEAVWREVFAGGDAPMGLTAHATFPFAETITLGQLKGRVLSASYIARLEKDRQSRVLRELEQMIGSAVDGTAVAMKHLTHIHVAHRRDGSG
jgi:SAM-dependent methyltransferase